MTRRDTKQEEAEVQKKKGENSEDSDELGGCVNILTAIDVRNTPKGDDQRVGDVGAQIKRIGYERQPMKMQLLTEQEMHRHHPDRVRVQDDEQWLTSQGSGTYFASLRSKRKICPCLGALCFLGEIEL